jgi:NAD(P)-dependent dehydrogenase (short-subunit alcohol dehydrogenase family)
MTDGLRTFDGGVAIVTGAASGIGRAISKALAQRGCQVVLADIDCGDAETAAAQIRDKGGRASAKHLDVCNFAAVSELVTETMEKLGRIDYLFNNAGIGVFGEVADYPLDAWHRVIAVNLGGVVNGVQAAYAAMIRQGFGHIVNTASIAGLTTSPAAASYSATKHAVVGLSKALRAEAQCRGVRVSVICPGVIRTPLLRGGKHGIFLMPLPEDKQREIVGQLFELLRPMDVSIFARKVLDRVARNRAIIVVPGWYKIFWWIERASPTLGAFLARKAFERYRKLLFPSGGPTHDKANRDAT